MEFSHLSLHLSPSVWMVTYRFTSLKQIAHLLRIIEAADLDDLLVSDSDQPTVLHAEIQTIPSNRSSCVEIHGRLVVIHEYSIDNWPSKSFNALTQSAKYLLCVRLLSLVAPTHGRSAVRCPDYIIRECVEKSWTEAMFRNDAEDRFDKVACLGGIGGIHHDGSKGYELDMTEDG